MDRRAFLQWQMKGLVALAAGSSLLSLPGRALGTQITDIGVATGLPGPATRAAVGLLGGMGRFVKAGQKVVIKPNMSFGRGPESATNTHPEVVRELVILCLEAGASRIRVLDHSLHDPELALDRSGIRAACDGVAPGICRHLMNPSFYQEADIAGGVQMRANAFMRDALGADVIIAAPVAKSHGGAGVSLSLKGQMGLILDRGSMHSRYDLASSIVDLNMRIKPDLAVIDASRVLTSGGPGGPGKVITPGEIIASADPVAADALAVASYEWSGQNVQPRQVPHIRLAHERGLGRMDIENLVTARVAA
ncbi:MAG: DUF362 domain-containing protein [Desulfovibrio sp.]|jgi:uncharacterized protein (DUF362 family)|nr:DUF362 domain-containing protein [Desulfovibrio sp.]